ncbi:Adenylate kinase [Rhizobium tibeticum]|uniref:Adenylate kinase n=1 Tax=Rhizobium tibeticum TaxID=501024 RepID=A0A1H8MEM2_9HYPH|nr:AAA family ATPase [Rhizobium tibeticum]SEH92430.1 topology modulation protein [Rhizobium tibeticum]SEO15779.1 Adenylate kinase [Rhizobium tibeticum]
MPNFITDFAHAAELLLRSKRVLVVGCSGGGKTTLSRQLARRLGISHISMDREFYWLPGWVKRPKAEERDLIAVAVASERWLMDGTGSSTFDLRLPRTEFVLWVRLPRWRCVLGVTGRWLRWRGRARPELPAGCPEKLDLEFLRFIWSFERRFVPHIVAGIDRFSPDVPVLQLKSHQEMRRLLDLLGAPT